MAISRSSALPVNALLIFDMHDLNAAILWKVRFYFLLLASLVPPTITVTFRTI